MEKKDLIEYFDARKCLICEPSISFANSIQQTFLDLGMISNNIVLSKNYDQAVQHIKSHRPEIIVSEYHLGKSFGLNLKLIQNENTADPEANIFFVVTANASESAVAEAAEEDVDNYILKPFSKEDFTSKLIGVIQSRKFPTDYQLGVKEGKLKLAEKLFSEALKIFNFTQQMSDQPSLACYYAGYCEQSLDHHNKALSQFNKGLGANPMHYKCLVGAFETLFALKDYKGAYELVKKIANNFPTTPKRLGKFFITAVYTYNFQDINYFYNIFRTLDQRPPELVQIMSAAAYTAAKFSLREKKVKQACEFFEMACIIKARSQEICDKVIEELVGCELYPEAREFYTKYPRELVGGKMHAQLGFAIDCNLLPVAKVIELGKSIVAKGHANEMVYKELVKALVRSGRKVNAEGVIAHALKDFPDLRRELYGLLEG